MAGNDSDEDKVREAIEFHIEGLRESGEVVPEPHSFSESVEVDAA